ncbi:MAG: 16S rRNA (uracil(1498)-N(3))-methyltransferase [Pyrinomonadaceae bacterium]
MTRRRFYAPASAFAANRESGTVAGDEARHLLDVLRLGRGDEVFVFDGQGREYRCVVGEVERGSAHFNVIEEVEPGSSESPLKLTLAVALLKGEKFDLVVQKTTELGVTRIVPLKTTRADVRLPDSAEARKRVTRWQRIALEAAKQSGRAFVPQVAAPIEFSLWLRSNESISEQRMMFSERGGAPLWETISHWPAKPGTITALVGSEGGWADDELEQARETGCQIITLGGRTLRAETAAIAATGLLQHLFGDLK